MTAVAQVIASLLRVASEDLDGARQLCSTGNRNAIYLCQQAVEKILRAMLTSEGTHAGVKHDLDQMTGELPDENPFKARMHPLAYLTRFATSFRYPTSAGRIVAAPSPDATLQAITQVAALLESAAHHFGVDLEKEVGPAAVTTPPR